MPKASKQVIRAAIAYKDLGLGEPILIGTEDIVRTNMAELGLDGRTDIEIRDTALHHSVTPMPNFYSANYSGRGGFTATAFGWSQ